MNVIPRLPRGAILETAVEMLLVGLCSVASFYGVTALIELPLIVSVA